MSDKVVRIGGIYDNDKVHQMGSVWDQKYLSPTIDTAGGGYRQPLIVVRYERYNKNKGSK